MRWTPALRSLGASKPSGAAAPNSTVSQPSRSMMRSARCATEGTGSISEVGWRTTGKGSSASNFACLGRRVDGHVLRRQPQRQRVHEELDSTRPWRKIVGQDKDLRHGTALPGSRAHTDLGRRPAPTAIVKILKYLA